MSLQYFYRVPLCVPYWNGATYRAILRSLFSGTVIDGPALGKLNSLVIERLGVEEAVLCGSGSLALEMVLQACDVRKGDEVVIPSFCCSAIVPPILAVGAVPVLADIGENLNVTPETVERALTKKTKAVVVPHLFGNPADIHAIMDLTRGSGIRVIDDAAQALGAMIDGRPVGSLGDGGILSFGSEKVCFGLGGGVAVSRNKEILNGNLKVDLAQPRSSPAVQIFLSTMVWRRWTLPLKALFSRAETTDPDSPPSPYRRETMTNLSAAVALTLMQTLSENIAARRARVQAYQGLLGGVKRLELVPHGPGSACLTQVVRILPRPRGDDLSTHLIEALGKAGYEVRGSYVPIHLLSQFEFCVRERLAHTERVWSDLIELPCEPEVSLDHVERIAGIIKQVLKKVRGGSEKGGGLERGKAISRHNVQSTLASIEPSWW